jgi:antitoxin (DNA-binding transcriptional repressor) of toxin-antitoxin stability system
VSSEITSEELGARYFEIMKRVCQGENFTITIDGREMAEIRPSHRGVEDVEAVKVFGELCSSKFEGASDETIQERLEEGQQEKTNTVQF